MCARGVTPGASGKQMCARGVTPGVSGVEMCAHGVTPDASGKQMCARGGAPCACGAPQVLGIADRVGNRRLDVDFCRNRASSLALRIRSTERPGKEVKRTCITRARTHVR